MSTGNQSGQQLAWAQADVFAENAFEGNMLAIFPDATGLSGEQMQALARETNLSETTFVLPSTPEEERAADAVLNTLCHAFPSNLDASRAKTVFSLHLGPVFVREIWHRAGEDDDTNAAHALHDALTRDPGAGFTHLAPLVFETVINGLGDCRCHGGIPP